MNVMEHNIHRSLLTDRVRVHLVGVGGNGAQMAHSLARLDTAIRALGHPCGLHVTAFDGDTVSESNIGRQVYGPADVGQFKSVLTIQRLNHFYGLDWDAVPCRYEPKADLRYEHEPHLVVSCVDSASARRDMHQGFFGNGRRARYWMDLGNTDTTAQVVLGVATGHRLAERDEWFRLPCVTELFPQLMTSAVPEDDAPSCSVAISLASQGLFVNDMAVRWAGQLLYELFSEGRLKQHGVLINLKAKRAGPIDVDPQVWKRFGVRRRRPRGMAEDSRGMRERATT
jgi:PRTRC genetic system ThiF family protein